MLGRTRYGIHCRRFLSLGKLKLGNDAVAMWTNERRRSFRRGTMHDFPDVVYADAVFIGEFDESRTFRLLRPDFRYLARIDFFAPVGHSVRRSLGPARFPPLVSVDPVPRRADV